MKYTTPEATTTPLDGALESSDGDYQGSMVYTG